MENVAENAIPNPDLGPDLPKMPFGDGNFKMPSLEEFMKMLEQMENMSDEEKEELQREVMKNSMPSRKMEAGLPEYLVFSTMVIIIASVFVFFGYKLYLSLTEKERKREEKMKAKQAKKKKWDVAQRGGGFGYTGNKTTRHPQHKHIPQNKDL